jgi:hypothetical protein
MAANRKFTISGPGAADFLASPGGEDRPGSSGSKGTSQTRGDGITSDVRNLEPAFASDKDAQPPERAASAPADADPDQRTGSQTGTIGGGGADAHNADPVRATGVDDPTAAKSGKQTQKKRTTKKY